MSKRFTRHGWLATIAVGVLLAAGCSEKKPTRTTPDPGPDYRERTSPANVLHNLGVSYRAQDIDGYIEQLHEAFSFIPNQKDGEVHYESLSYDDDVESTRNMFEQVDAIEITLTHPEDEPSDYGEFPADDGYRQILVSSVRMDVTTRLEIDGEALIYQVAGDPATFIFTPDATQSPVTWKIVYQKDDS